MSTPDSAELWLGRIFDGLGPYLQALSEGEISFDGEELNDDIVIFCETFFEELFNTEFGYEAGSPSAENKRWAVWKRVKLESTGNRPELCALIVYFEKLCDLWPDIKQASYAEAPLGFVYLFHEGYILPLLERIHAWAIKAQLSAAVRAQQAADLLESAI